MSNNKMYVCVLCKTEHFGYGNNPAPISSSGVCCDNCNLSLVIPVRLDIPASRKTNNSNTSNVSSIFTYAKGTTWPRQSTIPEHLDKWEDTTVEETLGFGTGSRTIPLPLDKSLYCSGCANPPEHCSCFNDECEECGECELCECNNDDD